MSETGADPASILSRTLEGIDDLDKCINEDCIVKAISSLTECRPHEQLRGIKPDLLCNGLVIEVEFNKAPYEGLQQAMGYRALLGLPTMLLHVVTSGHERHTEALMKIRRLICDKNIYLSVISITNECAAIIKEDNIIHICRGRGR